ncbi:MAG: hypothetical protein JNL79_10380 [Myxococcales bacterium]|nr:hypothetical protein [Myxococcales bacterium]
MKLRAYALLLLAGSTGAALVTGCSSATDAPGGPSGDAEIEDTGTEGDAAIDTLVEDAPVDSAASDTAPSDSGPKDTGPEVATECTPGATDTAACGNCGTHARTCTGSGVWSVFGACSGEGVCAAGGSRVVTCGKCGSRTESCSSTCAWDSSAACTGEGVCTPGEIQTEAGTCTGKNVRTRTCSSSCAWGDWACVAPKGWVDVTTSPLSARSAHTAVWTGTEMLVFGGNPSLADGAGYSIASDTWRTIAAATVGRESHTAVWTGSKMIVWGGYGGGALRNDGASYDPVANTWTAIATTTLPARMDQTAVWTGTEMIVWGGQTSSGGALGDGAAYNPATNSWRTIATPTSFGRRFGHRAVWAGGRMVVFGGYDYFSGFSSPAPNTCAVKTATSFCGDAAAYNPATDTWTVLTPPTPELDPRQRNAGVVLGATGGRALFWGGEGNTSGGSLFRSSGAFYDVAAGTWTTMVAPTETLLPGAKRASMAAWSTADTFFVWGGRTGTASYSATGASYDVATSTWKALPTLNAPSARAFATTIWTGTEAVVWGGSGSSGTLKDGKIYRP